MPKKKILPNVTQFLATEDLPPLNEDAQIEWVRQRSFQMMKISPEESSSATGATANPAIRIIHNPFDNKSKKKDARPTTPSSQQSGQTHLPLSKEAEEQEKKDRLYAESLDQAAVALGIKKHILTLGIIKALASAPTSSTTTTAGASPSYSSEGEGIPSMPQASTAGESQRSQAAVRAFQFGTRASTSQWRDGILSEWQAWFTSIANLAAPPPPMPADAASTVADQSPSTGSSSVRAAPLPRRTSLSALFPMPTAATNKPKPAPALLTTTFEEPQTETASCRAISQLKHNGTSTSANSGGIDEAAQFLQLFQLACWLLRTYTHPVRVSDTFEAVVSTHSQSDSTIQPAIDALAISSPQQIYINFNLANAFLFKFLEVRAFSYCRHIVDYHVTVFLPSLPLPAEPGSGPEVIVDLRSKPMYFHGICKLMETCTRDLEFFKYVLASWKPHMNSAALQFYIEFVAMSKFLREDEAGMVEWLVENGLISVNGNFYAAEEGKITRKNCKQWANENGKRRVSFLLEQLSLASTAANAAPSGTQ